MESAARRSIRSAVLNFVVLNRRNESRGIASKSDHCPDPESWLALSGFGSLHPKAMSVGSTDHGKSDGMVLNIAAAQEGYGSFPFIESVL